MAPATVKSSAGQVVRMLGSDGAHLIRLGCEKWRKWRQKIDQGNEHFFLETKEFFILI